MIGILLITHNGLGDSLIDCVKHVTGSVPDNLKSLSVLAEDDPESKEIEGKTLMQQLNMGEGVLILSDIFGATPSNIALRLCKSDLVEGVAGVNLPMLLRVIFGPAELSLKEAAQRAFQGGRDCIVSMKSEQNRCNVYD